MPSLIRLIHRAASRPPHVTVGRVYRRLHRKWEMRRRRLRDQHHPTWAMGYRASAPLLRHFPAPPIATLRPHAELFAELTDCYLQHRFDLLGSGWQTVRYGVACPGVEGHRYSPGQEVQPDREGRWLQGHLSAPNLPEAQRLWSLLPSDYVPIDWHLDFKSGYRWSETAWYKAVDYGEAPGADVKVPWELARAQHLPHLAWAFALAQADAPGFQSAEVYLREFRNQVLDFMATNPPRYGVNWVCAMDVGIRIANWLVAYDLFRAYGAAFDAAFEEAFQRSVYEHAYHLQSNLEWSDTVRGNHYLADIVGLLFATAYLPSTPETPELDSWLAVAAQELCAEATLQFHPDGTNFEASTSYHRLSGEMLAYGAALLLGLPESKRAALAQADARYIPKPPGLTAPPNPLSETERGSVSTLHTPSPASKNAKENDSASPAALERKEKPNDSPLPPRGRGVGGEDALLLERLQGVAQFTIDITRPDGSIPQIGDNDSGRFLKLLPTMRRTTVGEAKARADNLRGFNDLPDDATHWETDDLDHRHLVAAINGWFGQEDFAAFAGDATLETEIVAGLLGGERWTTQRATPALASALVDPATWTRWTTLCANAPEAQRRVTEFVLPGADLREGMRCVAYPDFGLYLFRSERLYLAVRCGCIGQNDHGGHAHNDQLSLELMADGDLLIADPGTYVYTPLPQRRNEYRSAQAHFAPYVEGMEPGNLRKGLFTLGDEARAEALFFDTLGFIGRHRGYGVPVYRLVAIEAERIVVTDVLHPEGTTDLRLAASPAPPPFSPGYGKRIRRPL